MFKIDPQYRKTLLLSSLVGLLVGVFGTGFFYLWHFLDRMADPILSVTINRIWFSAAAGFLIGLLIKLTFDPGSMATIIKHFHKAGELPVKDNLPIQPVSLMGLIAGQSAGPEGALTQAGGSIGSYVAKKAKASELKRVLTLAGMGAGFGAFLGSPVGGAILWLEMLHTRGMEYYEAIMPTVICSAVGYVVMFFLVGHGLVPPWHIEIHSFASNWSPVVAILIGLACGPVAKIYSFIFAWVGKSLNFRYIPLILQTTLAGLFIGLLGWLVPESYYYGGPQMLDFLKTSFTAQALLFILIAKMFAAALTVRGHWQGGLIIPHMFMGAVIGKLVVIWFPSVDSTMAMLVGMAAFNAAATQTPLASALIVLALTGTGIPVPIFLASIAAFIAGQGVVLIANKQSRDQWSGEQSSDGREMMTH